MEAPDGGGALGGKAPVAYPPEPRRGAPATPSAPVVRLPDYFYKRFAGTIGEDRHIVVNLTRMRSQIAGDCYDATKGIPLFFGYSSRIGSTGEVHLDASEGFNGIDEGGVSGTFDGAFVSPEEIAGTWRSAGSSTSAPFHVVEKADASLPRIDLLHAERGYYDGSHGSATAMFTYPFMAAGSDAAAQAFNSYEKSAVLGLCDSGVSEPPPTSVETAIRRFLGLFQQQLLAPVRRPGPNPPWIYQSWSSVVMSSGGLLSTESVAFSFEGGAHPDTLFRYATYDMARGAPVSLDEILEPDTKAKLDAIALRFFREEHGIPATQSLADAGYFVSDSEFHLNANFMVAPGGLMFRFNQYEIAPYAVGAPEVFIPFSALEAILRPESPISSLVAGG